MVEYDGTKVEEDGWKEKQKMIEDVEDDGTKVEEDGRKVENDRKCRR